MRPSPVHPISLHPTSLHPTSLRRAAEGASPRPTGPGTVIPVVGCLVASVVVVDPPVAAAWVLLVVGQFALLAAIVLRELTSSRPARFGGHGWRSCAGWCTVLGRAGVTAAATAVLVLAVVDGPDLGGVGPAFWLGLGLGVLLSAYVRTVASPGPTGGRPGPGRPA